MIKRINVLIVTSLICVLCLSACGNSNLPSIIQYNNKTISYNTTKSDVEKSIGNGEQSTSIIPNTINYDKSIQISYNDTNKVRCIEIDSSDATTYNNIKVGDSISDVLKKYKYEQKNGNNYMVAFSNNNEIDITDKNSTVDFLINYYVKDDKISKIQLYDSTFAKIMK